MTEVDSSLVVWFRLHTLWKWLESIHLWLLGANFTLYERHVVCFQLRETGYKVGIFRPLATCARGGSSDLVHLWCGSCVRELSLTGSWKVSYGVSNYWCLCKKFVVRWIEKSMHIYKERRHILPRKWAKIAEAMRSELKLSLTTACGFTSLLDLRVRLTFSFALEWHLWTRWETSLLVWYLYMTIIVNVWQLISRGFSVIRWCAQINQFLKKLHERIRYSWIAQIGQLFWHGSL